MHPIQARIGPESIQREVLLDSSRSLERQGGLPTTILGASRQWLPVSSSVMLPRRLTPQTPWHKHEATRAGMVKWYHTSLPSSWCGFDSRYPLQPAPVELRRLVTTSRLECGMVEGGAG